MVKNLSAMQKTLVRSLGWEDPLEKKMATHSSIFAWELAWTEEPEGVSQVTKQFLKKTKAGRRGDNKIIVV